MAISGEILCSNNNFGAALFLSAPSLVLWLSFHFYKYLYILPVNLFCLISSMQSIKLILLFLFWPLWLHSWFSFNLSDHSRLLLGFLSSIFSCLFFLCIFLFVRYHSELQLCLSSLYSIYNSHIDLTLHLPICHPHIDVTLPTQILYDLNHTSLIN